MKTGYRKEFCYRSKEKNDWHYSSLRAGYYRKIRTFPELRRNAADAVDYRDEPHIDVKRGRGRNSNKLDAWNDFPVSRTGGRSWKDYTRHRKQWMTGDDPKPKTMPPRRGWGWLVYWGLEHYDH